MGWIEPRRSDLWSAMAGMQGELERALDLFRTPESSGLFDADRVPAVDFVETADEYRIEVELPGVDKKDLEVSVAGGVLAIKGAKKAEAEAGKLRVFRKETWAGSFARTLSLPEDADAEKVEASLKDGLLEIRVAKLAEAKPRLISVAQ